MGKYKFGWKYCLLISLYLVYLVCIETAGSIDQLGKNIGAHTLFWNFWQRRNSNSSNQHNVGVIVCLFENSSMDGNNFVHFCPNKKFEKQTATDIRIEAKLFALFIIINSKKWLNEPSFSDKLNDSTNNIVSNLFYFLSFSILFSLCIFIITNSPKLKKSSTESKLRNLRISNFQAINLKKSIFRLIICKKKWIFRKL